MDLQLHSYTLLMENTYLRLTSGIFYDTNLKIYTKDFMIKVLNYFERQEQYEKCSEVKDLINKIK